MDPVEDFISKLTALINESNFEITGSNEGDIELHDKVSGGMIGYWGYKITVGQFRDLR